MNRVPEGLVEDSEVAVVLVGEVAANGYRA
jgi:hypothetical protein